MSNFGKKERGKTSIKKKIIISVLLFLVLITNSIVSNAAELALVGNQYFGTIYYKSDVKVYTKNAWRGYYVDGVEVAWYRSYTVTKEGSHTVKNGNTTLGTIILDKTPPTINIRNEAAGDKKVRKYVTATDVTSHIDWIGVVDASNGKVLYSCRNQTYLSFEINKEKVAKAYTVKAMDKAGWTSTQTFTVQALPTTTTSSKPSKPSTGSSASSVASTTVKPPVKYTSSGSGSGSGSSGSGSSSSGSGSGSTTTPTVTKDTTKPTIISITNKSGSTKVKDKVEIVAKVKDNESGIKGYVLNTNTTATTSTKMTTFDNPIVKTEKEITIPVTKNGTYYLHVKDKEGNIASKAIKVDNIDSKGPTIAAPTLKDSKTYAKELQYSSTLKDDAGIKRYAVSKESDVKKLKDSDWKSVSGNPKEQSINFKINANGTYYIHAEDSLGNASKKSFKVDKVDNVVPTINSVECNTKQKVAKSTGVKVTVKASDKESGIDFIAIDKNSKANYEEAKKYNDSAKVSKTTANFTVKENGVWYVHAFDKCGNAATKRIVIDNLVDNVGAYTAQSVNINKIEDKSQTKFLKDDFVLSTDYETIKRVVLNNTSLGIIRGYWLGYIENAGIMKSYDRNNDPSPYIGDYENPSKMKCKITTATARTALRMSEELGDDSYNYNNVLDEIAKGVKDKDIIKRYISDTLQTFAFDIDGNGIITKAESDTLLEYSAKTTTTEDILTKSTQNNKKYLFPVIQDEGEYEFDIVRYVDENDHTKKGVTRLDAETYKFVLDKTAPTVKVKKDEMYSTDKITYYTGVAADNLTNIVAYQFRTDSDIPAQNNKDWNTVSKNNQSLALEVRQEFSANDEINNLILWVMDEAGNIGYGDILEEDLQINEDVKSPTISKFSIDSTKAPEEGDVMQSVVAKASDEHLKYYQFSSNGSLDVESDGWINLDKAGNAQNQIISDTTKGGKRSVTINAEIPIYDDYGKKVKIKDYYFYVKDEDGNMSVQSLVDDEFKRDTQRPYIVGIEEENEGDSNNKNLIIKATDFDGGTGVKSYKFTQRKDEYNSDEFTKETAKAFTEVADIIEQPSQANNYIMKFRVNVKNPGAYFFQIKDSATGKDAYEHEYLPNYSSKKGKINEDIDIASMYAKAGNATFELNQGRSNISINETIATVLNIQKDADDPLSEMRIKYKRYGSSDNNIATIDESGNVTGISKGKVTLSATAVNFDNTSITQETTINVVDELTHIEEQPTRKLVVGEQETELFTSIDKGTNASIKWYALDQNVTLDENVDPATVTGATIVTTTEESKVADANIPDLEHVKASNLKLSVAEVNKGKKYVARIANNSDIVNPPLVTAVNTNVVSVISIKQPNTPVITATYANGTRVTSGDWANQEIRLTPNSTYTGTSGDIIYQYAVKSKNAETGEYDLPKEEDWINYDEKAGLVFGEDDQTKGKMIYFRAYTVYSGATEEEAIDIKNFSLTDNIEVNGFEEPYAKFELKLDMVEPEFESYELVPVDFNGNEIEEITIPATDTKMSQNYIVKAKIKDNFISNVKLDLTMDNIGQTKHNEAEYVIDSDCFNDDELKNGTYELSINLYDRFDSFKDLESELYHIITKLTDEAFPNVKEANNKQNDRLLDFNIDEASTVSLNRYDDNAEITGQEKTINGRKTNADDKAIDEKFYIVGSLKNGIKMTLNPGRDDMSGINNSDDSISYTISAYSRENYNKMINIINDTDEELNNKRSSLQSKQKELEDKRNNLSNKYQELEGKVDELNDKNISLMNKEAELNKIVKDIENIVEPSEDEKKQLQELNANKEKIQNEIITLKDEISHLEEEINALNNEKNAIDTEINELENEIDNLEMEIRDSVGINFFPESKETVAVEPGELNYILSWDGCYVIDARTTDNLNNVAHRYYYLVVDNNGSDDTRSSVIKYTDLSETEARIKVEIEDVSGIGSVQFKWTTDAEEIAKFNEGKYDEIEGWKDADGSYPEYSVSTNNSEIEGEATLIIVAEDDLGNKEPFSKVFKIDGKVTSPATMVFETIDDKEIIKDTKLPNENNEIYANDFGFISIIPGYDINVYNNNKEELLTTYSYSLNGNENVGEQDKSGRIKAKITQEGVYTVEVKSQDKLNNEATVTYTLYVDKTGPEITYDGTTRNGTIKEEVSGIAWAKYIYTRGYTPTEEEVEEEGTVIEGNSFTGVVPDVDISGNAWFITILTYDKAGNKGYFTNTTGQTWHPDNSEDDSAPIASELQNPIFDYIDTNSVIEFNEDRSGDISKEVASGTVLTHKDRIYTAKELPEKEVAYVKANYTESYDAQSDIQEEKIEVYKGEELIYTLINKKQENGVMKQESLEGESEEVTINPENREIVFNCIQDREEVYKIIIKATNGNNLTSINTYIISVDKKAPEVKFTPNGNEDWVYGYKDDKEIYDETAVYESPIIVEIEDAMAGVDITKTNYYWTVNDERVGKIVEASSITEDDSTKEDSKKEKFSVEIPSEVAEILENTVAGLAKLHVYTEDNKQNSVNKWVLENEVPDEWNVSDEYKIDNVRPTAPKIQAYYKKYYTGVSDEKGFENPYYEGMTTSSNVRIVTNDSYAASGIKKYQYSIYNEESKTWGAWEELDNIKYEGSEITSYGTFTISEEGKTIVKTRAVNMVGRAGGPEEESEPFVILIDRTAPEVEFHNMTVNRNSKEGGTNGIYVVDETVKVVVQDDPSGVNINRSKYQWIKEEIITNEEGTKESKYEADPSKAKQLILADGEATIRMPDNAEGNYKLWVYVEDNVNRGDATGNGAEHLSEVYKFDSKVPEAPILTATVPGKKQETITKEDGTTEIREVDADVELPSGSITNKTVTLHMVMADDKEPVSGVAKYQYSIDEKTTWNDLNVPEDGDTKVNIETEGTYRIFIRAINGAGNVGIESIYEVMVDKTKPTVGITPNGTSGAVKSISVVINAKDTLSGLVENDEYECYVSNSQEIDANATTTKFKNGETLNLIGDGLTGEYYLHIRPISDKAGNETEEFVSNKFIFNNETDKPVVTFTNIVTPEENSNVKVPNGTGENNWVRGIRVRVTVKDLDRTDENNFLIKASGVNPNTIKYKWAAEGETLQASDFAQLGNEGDITTEYPVATPVGVAGKYTLYVYAEDNFGNNILAHSEVYYIDDIAPTGSLVIKGSIVEGEETVEIESDKITNKNVTLTVEGATAASGVKYQYSIDGGDKWRDTEMTEDGKGTVTFTEESKYSVIFRAVGGTGIPGEPSEAFKFTIDKTKPEVTVKYIPEGLTNEKVLVTITANEDIRPVDGWTLSDDKRVLSKEFTENTEETVEIVDIAGNITEAKINVTNIDREDLVVNQTQVYVDGGVLVTITANKKLKRVEGWTAIDEYTITKLYQKDAVEVLELEDIAGNKAKETVVVTLNKEGIKPNEGDITYNVVPSELESKDGKKEYYLRIYNKDVTLGTLLRNLVLNGDKSYTVYEVVNGEKTEVPANKVESTKVKTGSIIIEFATTRYTTIIMGNLDKDGAITFKDIEIENKIRLHPEEASETLEEILKIASDINGDGKVTFMEDMVKINALRLKKVEQNFIE